MFGVSLIDWVRRLMRDVAYCSMEASGVSYDVRARFADLSALVLVTSRPPLLGFSKAPSYTSFCKVHKRSTPQEAILLSLKLFI